MRVLASELGEKFQGVPRENWRNLGLAIIIIVVVIFLIRKAAKMNRIILVIISTMILIILTMTWVYERNEPSFLTPAIDAIRPFFPSAPPPLSARPQAGDLGENKKPQAGDLGENKKPQAGDQGDSKKPPSGKPTTTVRPKVY